ncbi:MAG: sugar ABC transporter permease [Anaerolineaceae bacterium]|nr:sugar ABC transporter permease [Anaerolineaceae bacterium]
MADKVIQRRLLIGVLFIASLVMLFPLYWLVTGALKTEVELMRIPPTLWPLEPRPQNFIEAWSVGDFTRYTFNSLIIAAGTVIGVVVSSTMAGYALAKYRFRGRTVFFSFILLTLLIPGQSTAIPLYLRMRDLSLLNNPLGVILPAVAGGFGTFLVRQYLQAFPSELLDAARIDGAGEFRIFAQIVVPHLGPVIATLVIIVFMASWDSFFWPLIVLSSPGNYTLPIGIALFQDQYVTTRSYVLAVSALATVPVLVVFALAQRHFIEGIALSGLK